MSGAPAFVIVGAGLAGAKAAQALREQGFTGSLTLIGDEQNRPYERPPLSKGYLMGTAERDSVFVHDEDFYAQNAIELELGVAATGIDRSGRTVALAGGRIVRYDKLLLATGAQPRELALADADTAGLYYLRNLEDSDRLRLVFAHGIKLVIIGAGWIGLEVAAAARQAGAAVTVLERAELPLLRILGPEVAAVFADLHRDHGVELRLKTVTARITTAGGRVCGVELADGTQIAADAVLAAVGVQPRTSLAEQAGLTLDNGILTDQHLSSSDPDILAVGDVANAYHPVLGTHLRVEHWANALKQPETAAATMLGRDASYTDLPYFFTDQYDLGMEYVGYTEPGGYDELVVRGDLRTREFIAFWVSAGRVRAGMNVNVWDVVDEVKRLIASGASVDLARLADPNVALAEVIGQ
jgi:3-phenylpropionate/trans-cinnamate dioxygenase ferredoxin reductase subunit